VGHADDDVGDAEGRGHVEAFNEHRDRRFAAFDGEALLAKEALVDEALEALRTAQTLARNAPLSIRQVKKAIRYGGQMELRTAYRFEVEAYNQLVDTEDRHEGVLAFNEKRPPVFKGC
jgi:enoyl-CoA hydratase/carnithine racemase